MPSTDSTVNLPGSDILFARLAQRLMESGEVEEATKICEKGLRKYPTYAQAHYVLACCYMNQHMTDESRIELERVLRYDPNHVNAIKDLSSIYFINGFQDLYREYLLKLFVLCPLNEEIIDEVRKLGDYEHWAATPLEAEKPKITAPRKVEPKAGEDKKMQAGDKPPVKLPESDDTLFPEKVDLSQFDNLQDDFTTILHGNLDLPVRRPQSEAAGSDLNLRRDDIFADESETVVDQNAEGEEETMDELLGDDEELVVEKQKPTDKAEEERPAPEIIIPHDREQAADQILKDAEPKVAGTTRPGQPESSRKEIPAPPLESIDVKEMPVPEDKSPAPAVSDFNHLQDDDETHFEQPKIISQTLGEILVSQKKYAEAKSVFEALKEKHPQNKTLDVKISFLEKIINLEKGSKS